MTALVTMPRRHGTSDALAASADSVVIEPMPAAIASPMRECRVVRVR